MAREFLRITPEVTWGVFNSGGTHTIVQVDQNNAFTMRPMPIMVDIRTAGGFNRRWQKVAQKAEVKGSLQTLAYPSQQAAIKAWVCATSSSVLGSCTIDHVIKREDSGGTLTYRRYLGAMVGQAAFTSSEADQIARWNLDLVAGQVATITGSDFTEPVPSAYPIDTPYCFEQASGAFNIAGAPRTHFETFNLTIKNILDVRFFESQYPSIIKYCGRDVDWDTRFLYTDVTDRAALEAVTAVAGNITFTNGAHTLEFDMKTNDFYAEVTDDLALDKAFLESLKMNAFYDVSNTNDFDISLT